MHNPVTYAMNNPEIQWRLPTLVLRKEYFDCPLRGSHAVHYI
jgi:hypothetical protein